MITWIIIFIVIGGAVGYFMKGETSDGAAEGAATGFALFMTILIKIVLPILLLMFLFRACFG